VLETNILISKPSDKDKNNEKKKLVLMMVGVKDKVMVGIFHGQIQLPRSVGLVGTH